MKRLEIKIGNRTYFLKFGYGCFRHLAETWGVPGLTDIIVKFSSVGTGGDITLNDMEMFIDLARSAVYANGSLEEINAFDGDDFGDELLKDPSLISTIVAHFMESLPKSDSNEGGLGKKKAVRAKPDLPN
ncbi:hypothetical protein ASG38_14985 [Flavobacterium sp. Leaf359]|uniref:hypothetical protein n=1 Tax=Flavobacterium sp. Leaf359 TaxID=1736351 RepID=UPI0006FA4908|nr:hypothetical protein [Flavobacterium sp. Leaf359]KQS45912.1 hypothetical protein ASG38_14985 [Flavobacterium sp. Leaf359]